MALTKVQAEGINLADTFAFSGTVTGTGMVKLYTNTSSSATSSLDFGSTYISSTYDHYYVTGHVLPPDNTHVYLKLKNSSGIITGSKHGQDIQYGGTGDLSDGLDHIRLNYSNVGGAAGEGSQFSFYLQHVNSDTIPCSVIAFARAHYTNGNPEGTLNIAGLIASAYATVVTGFNISASDGNNLQSHNITVYGIAK